MLTIVEFDPSQRHRPPTGRFTRVEATRETLQTVLLMMGIIATVTNNGLVGDNLFAYRAQLTIPSDWVLTPLNELFH